MNWTEEQFQKAVAVAILTLAVLFCYLGTWWNGFVFDDHVYVTGNPLVAQPAGLHAIFTSSYPPESPDQGLYRPLLTLSYRGDAALWGVSHPEDAINGFHLTNTLMHLACVLLVFGLLLRLRFHQATAFGAALLFAVHPVLTESVAWIVGRAEIGAAVFVLLAIHLLMSKRAWLRWLAPAAWLAGLCFKESAVMAPVMAIVLWRYRPEAFGRWGRAERIALPVAVAAALGIYAGMRAIALPTVTPGLTPFVIFASPLDRMATAVVMLWKYLWYVFFPIPQSVFHDLKPSGVGEPGFWGALTGWGLLIWALWRWRAVTRDWRYGLLWWMTALFPVSNLVLPIGTVFAERFLYLPGLMLYTALIESVRAWMAGPNAYRLRYPKSWGRIAAVMLALFLLGYAITIHATVRRTGEWRSDLTLWESTLARYPDSFAAAAPYASALRRAGRLEEAMEYLKRSEQGFADAPQAYRELFGPRLHQLRLQIQLGLDRARYSRETAEGHRLLNEGQPKMALEVFENLAGKYPQFSEGEESIGDVYLSLGNEMGAIQHYKRAILIDPNRGVLFGKMAQALAKVGAHNHAIEMYERSLVLEPGNPITNYNLSVLWNDIGQLDKAIYYMEKAVASQAAFVPARLNLASFYRTKGRDDDAITQLQEVLRLDPRNPDAQKLLRKVSKQSLKATPEPDTH